MALPPLPEQLDARGRTVSQLTIRTWSEADLGAMQALMEVSLDHLRPWMAWARREPLTIAQRTRLFRHWDRYRKSGRGAIYAVLEGDELLGGCALHRRVGLGGLDIGYWLGIRALGKGHATAVARRLVDTAIDLDDVDFVQISHESSNSASAAVAKRLGFEAVSTGDPNAMTWRMTTLPDNR